MSGYPDYRHPKPLSAPLTELEEAFVTNLVDHNMAPGEALLTARKENPVAARHMHDENGVLKEPRRPNVRGLQYERYLWAHVAKRIKERVSSNAKLAVQVLEQLMTGAESENVRLNAARDVLSRAGYDATVKQETTFKDITSLTDTELDEQISGMLGSGSGKNVTKLRA